MPLVPGAICSATHRHIPAGKRPEHSRELTALDAVGYAVGEPSVKGGPVLHRAASIVIFTPLTVIRTWFRVAADNGEG
jgi:hypothetical protein